MISHQCTFCYNGFARSGAFDMHSVYHRRGDCPMYRTLMPVFTYISMSRGKSGALLLNWRKFGQDIRVHIKCMGAVPNICNTSHFYFLGHCWKAYYIGCPCFFFFFLPKFVTHILNHPPPRWTTERELCTKPIYEYVPKRGVAVIVLLSLSLSLSLSFSLSLSLPPLSISIYLSFSFFPPFFFTLLS